MAKGKPRGDIKANGRKRYMRHQIVDILLREEEEVDDEGEGKTSGTTVMTSSGSRDRKRDPDSQLGVAVVG